MFFSCLILFLYVSLLGVLSVGRRLKKMVTIISRKSSGCNVALDGKNNESTPSDIF